MPITILPDSPLNQVKLNIGDEAGELIADAVITYLLSQDGATVTSVSLKAIDYCIAEAAKLADETTDKVSVRWSQVWDHLHTLKKKIQGDAAGSGDSPLFVFFGGTLKTENDKYYNDSNNVGCGIRVGDNSSTELTSRNPYNPYTI